MNTLIKIDEAVKIASKLRNKSVTRHNIMYLIQYGKISIIKNNNETFINRDELESYYQSNISNRKNWIDKYGDGLNWHLSFDDFREKDTTKHVHRLHPYKGKFIPQLVEYFLDNKTDEFKKDVFFKKDDIVLDPFCGSGTTLIQANELGINAIGIDVSSFNCMISRAKTSKVNMNILLPILQRMQKKLNSYENKIVTQYTFELNNLLKKHNKNLTAPIINVKSIEENKTKKEYIDNIFNYFYSEFLGIKKNNNLDVIFPKGSGKFIDTWYFQNIKDEMNIVFEEIKKIEDKAIKQLVAVILSRTIRSCRATTHSDLATLIKPQLEPYFCHKHNKICSPIISMKEMFSRYSGDTINRINEFATLRTKSYISILEGDSREIDLLKEIENKDSSFHDVLSYKKIDGIFSSPPYVGQIDYHEQHAYSYELFGLKRKDEKEIGPLYRGQGLEARQSYVQGISDVLVNCRKFLKENYNIFLVANDKYNLYPEIAKKSGMGIVNQFKRPVLNRTEKNKNLYSEEIFHLKNL